MQATCVRICRQYQSNFSPRNFSNRLTCSLQVRNKCTKSSILSVFNVNRTNISTLSSLKSSSVHFKQNEFLLYKCLNISYRNFKVSSPRRANPFIWLIIRPIIKVAAALTGRGFRKWWKSLPPEKRKYFLGLLKQNKVKVGGCISVLCFLAYYYYESHLEEVPLTGRKRFMAFDASQFKLIGEVQFEDSYEKYKHQVLPEFHPSTRRVSHVVHRILGANKDVKEFGGKTFAISVINSPEENAFVCPNGEIFVFTGMLNLCSNNDQLGAVLAHEISHCILAHGIENFSFVHLVDFLMAVIIGLVWAVLPSDSLAIVTHWLAKQVVTLLLRLPYSRKLEMEADEVGLKLAAKACFDVRESSAFWAKMAILHKKLDGGPDVEFLSTHPSHETRSIHLDSVMDEALKLRSGCGCPNLKLNDPRQDIEKLTKLLEDERRKYRPPVVIYMPPVPPA